MREIKFRAWETKYKKMAQIHRILWRTDINEIAFIEFDWKQFEEYPPSVIFRDISERVILMQFTGLKDKKGKEIYEGDILNFSNEHLNRYSIIEWCDKTASFKLRTKIKFNSCKRKDVKIHENLKQISKLEIVGNIYENPELIK